MLAMLTWTRFSSFRCLTMVGVVVGATLTVGCCQPAAFDMVLDVPPADRAKDCWAICGNVDLTENVDGLATCLTAADRATVVCTFTYADCPDALL